MRQSSSRSFSEWATIHLEVSGLFPVRRSGGAMRGTVFDATVKDLFSLKILRVEERGIDA